MQQKVAHSEALSREKIAVEKETAAQMESPARKLAQMEKEDRIDSLLSEIKARGAT